MTEFNVLRDFADAWRQSNGCVCAQTSSRNCPIHQWNLEHREKDSKVGYDTILSELSTLHAEKSGGYGTGDDPYANYTAVGALTNQPRYFYAIARSIEKLTRCLSLHEQGRCEELSEEFLDVASLMICAEDLRRNDS